MSDEFEDTEVDFTDPLRAGIYSLAFLIQGTEGDLPPRVVELIEMIIDQERNH